MTKTSEQKSPLVKIWDSPVRLFHGLIIILVGFSWYSVEQGEMEWHQWSGIAILTVVTTRIVWGFLGSDTARFSHFLHGPGRLVRYIGGIVRREHQTVVGHTPPGGWMIVVMLLVLLALPILGLYANDDLFFEGPLAHTVDKDMSDLLTGYHMFGFDILMILIILHVAAVLVYRFVLRDNIISPMITGRRRFDGTVATPRFVNPLWAMLILAVVAAGIYWIVLR